jgi:hypothetical protein
MDEHLRLEGLILLPYGSAIFLPYFTCADPHGVLVNRP